MAKAARNQVSAEIPDPGKAVQIVLMNAVGAAAADRIMRLVAQQRFPEVTEIITVEERIAAQMFQQNVQRFKLQFDHRLAPGILPFQRKPRGQCPLQNVAGGTAPQFPGYPGKCNVMFFHKMPHRRKIIAESLLPDDIRRDPPVQLPQYRQKILLRLKVIDPVHQQAV